MGALIICRDLPVCYFESLDILSVNVMDELFKHVTIKERYFHVYSFSCDSAYGLTNASLSSEAVVNSSLMGQRTEPGRLIFVLQNLRRKYSQVCGDV